MTASTDATPQTTALAVHQPSPVAVHDGPTFSLVPRTLEEAFKLSELLASSELVPKDYRGKPANVLVAVQMGAEVGLKPMQALASIAVVNGRASLWGDGLLALVLASPLCEYVNETWDAAGTAVCQAKRRGRPEQIRTFSDADAKQAGLAGKDGPWRSNPKRMKQMRARAFALRDAFADVIRGIPMAEEVLDLPAEPASTPTPLSQIAGVEQAKSIPPELLAAARAAADQGREQFAAYWKDTTNGGKTTKADRELLRPELPDLHRRTEEAAARASSAAVAPVAQGEASTDASGTAAAATSTSADDERVDEFVRDMERAEGAQGSES